MPITLDDAWSIGRRDAHAQAALVAGGEVSSDELVEAAILRIEDADGTLNAVSTRAFDHARRAVGEVDAAAPMAGVPYLLKASLAYPGFPQTSCSRSRAGVVANRAWPIAQRFDDAGLVPVGMSAMPEFGLLVSGEPLLGGAVLNPWNADASAGGSSTGAAVAVAAGMVPLAHAS
uniref:amidase family protein n=1 Tax=Sphingomonas bacterium TaxID=1895847 RepID=UPI0020C6EADB